MQPKEPQKDSLSWFSASGKVACDSEMLFLALLLCNSGIGAADLEGWAKEVLTLESEFDQLGSATAFKLPEKPEWRMAGSKPGAMLAPMAAAYNGTWTEDGLERIGSAMQACRGAGRINGLDVSRLKRHKAAKLTGDRAPSSKREGPPRWRTPQVLIGAARLVRGSSGVTLRKLLKLDTPLEEVPTIEMKLKEAEERVAELETENADLKTDLRKAKDAHWHSATRLKEKNTAVTEARRDERSKLKETQKSFKADTKTAAEAAVQDELDRLNRLRNDANARARQAENESAKHTRKI